MEYREVPSKEIDQIIREFLNSHDVPHLEMIKYALQTVGMLLVVSKINLENLIKIIQEKFPELEHEIAHTMKLSHRIQQAVFDHGISPPEE